MSLSEQEGQAFAVKILKTHIQKNRLAHTYLFTSGDLETKKEIVTNFMVSVLASSQGSDLQNIEKKVRDRNHPDVNWLGEDETVRILKIDQVRDLIAWSTLKPYESDWKLVAIISADRLNTQAQNALLKTLEEPPAKTIYCLLVENRSNLLDTIRSRSFELRIQPKSDSKVSAESLMIPDGFGQKRWEDFFEQNQSLAKPELFSFLDFLMEYFHFLLQTNSKPEYFQAWLDTLDALYETKDALDSNVNQKLALTRLAICFKKALPNPKMLMLEGVFE
jgi:hypothetical protein